MSRFVIIIGTITFLIIPFSRGFYPFIYTKSSGELSNHLFLEMNGLLVADYGENGSCSLRYYGWCPKTWNTTKDVPLEFLSYFQDETPTRTTFFRLIFEIQLFNSSGDLIYCGNKVLLSGSNTGYQFLCGSTQQTSWALPANITGITPGTSWDGLVNMNATVSYGGKTFSNTSNSVPITYQHSHHHAPSFSGESVLLGVLCVTVTMFLYKRTRRTK